MARATTRTHKAGADDCLTLNATYGRPVRPVGAADRGMRQGDGVHFIGIDLAWGDRQPTGLAVLDDDARLLHVSAVRTDDEIAAGLAAYVEGDGAGPSRSTRTRPRSCCSSCRRSCATRPNPDAMSICCAPSCSG